MIVATMPIADSPASYFLYFDKARRMMVHEQKGINVAQNKELQFVSPYRTERNQSSKEDVNEGLAYYACQDEDLFTKYGEGQTKWKLCFSRQGLFVTLVVLGLGLLTVTVEKVKQDRAQQESISFGQQLPAPKVYFESSSVNLYGKVVAHYMLVDWQPTVSTNDDDDHVSRFLIFDDVPEPRSYFLHGKTSSSFQGERGEGSVSTGVFPLYENVTDYNPMDETNTLYTFFWNTLDDGRTVDLKIDDREYDLMDGSIFLVTTHFGKPAQVQQLSLDLSQLLPPYEVVVVDDDETTTVATVDYDDDNDETFTAAQASVQYLVDEAPEIMTYLQQVASYNQ